MVVYQSFAHIFEVSIEQLIIASATVRQENAQQRELIPPFAARIIRRFADHSAAEFLEHRRPMESAERQTYMATPRPRVLGQHVRPDLVKNLSLALTQGNPQTIYAGRTHGNVSLVRAALRSATSSPDAPIISQMGATATPTRPGADRS